MMKNVESNGVDRNAPYLFPPFSIFDPIFALTPFSALLRRSERGRKGAERTRMSTASTVWRQPSVSLSGFGSDTN